MDVSFYIYICELTTINHNSKNALWDFGISNKTPNTNRSLQGWEWINISTIPILGAHCIEQISRIVWLFRYIWNKHKKEKKKLGKKKRKKISVGGIFLRVICVYGMDFLYAHRLVYNYLYGDHKSEKRSFSLCNHGDGERGEALCCVRCGISWPSGRIRDLTPTCLPASSLTWD